MEKISCDFYWITKCAAWKGGQHKRYIAEMALASQKGTKPLIVEYVSAALDGEGRLYARHSSAQQLPRLVRAIFYGNTHKEIDISGAHYELIRLGARSNLMPIGPLRDAFSRSFTEDFPDNPIKGDIQNDVKLFPILVINTGSLAACGTMANGRQDIPSRDGSESEQRSLYLPGIVSRKFCFRGFDLTFLLPIGTDTFTWQKPWKPFS